jgi:hypothetical protein
MATRSRIGIELDNGSILSVYLHFDGYPKFSGRILKTYYDTQRKVSSLIDGGDISCLWTNLGFNQETLPETGPLYYSQRGENCPPRLDDNLHDYLSDGVRCLVHQVYT